MLSMNYKKNKGAVKAFLVKNRLDTLAENLAREVKALENMKKAVEQGEEYPLIEMCESTGDYKCLYKYYTEGPSTQNPELKTKVIADFTITLIRREVLYKDNQEFLVLLFDNGREVKVCEKHLRRKAV